MSVSAQQIESFNEVFSKLEAHYGEFSALSKKAPDGALNAFKVGLINQVLGEINEFMAKEGAAVPGFEQFDDEALPTYSDIVVVLAQYRKALDRFHASNVQVSSIGQTYWITGGKLEVKTHPVRR